MNIALPSPSLSGLEKTLLTRSFRDVFHGTLALCESRSSAERFRAHRVDTGHGRECSRMHHAGAAHVSTVTLYSTVQQWLFLQQPFLAKYIPFKKPPFRLVAYVLWCWPREKEEEQLKWSLAFRLYIGSFPCAQLPGPVHTARLGRVCFYI